MSILTRRKFLWTTGIVGAGLVVGFSMRRPSPFPIAAEKDGWVANAFLQITPDNLVRFYCPRDEMGQGVSTGLATLIGEELDVAPGDMLVEFAGVHPDYLNPEFGVQATGGSTSIKGHFEPLRQVGADLRTLIVEAAAQELGIAAGGIKTADAHVIANGKRYPYGQFASTAAALPLPSGSPLKPKSAWKYIGKDFPRIDGIAKSTGTAEFGIDVDLPGMHRAVVRRSPVAGGKPILVDAGKTKQMPGVTDVVTIGSGVAVVAEKFWQARQAAAALEIEWDQPALSQYNTERIRADYQAALAAEEGTTTAAEGDVVAGLDAAAKTIDAEYWAPFLAHAPMEPMNAVVRIQDGMVDVWSGTQGAAGAQGLVARALDVDAENVRVHTQYLGGGFGRRGTLGHVIEAAELARQTGKTVQVIWTREDDIQNGLYRPASLLRIKAGVDGEGALTTWDATRVGGNITPDMLSSALPAFLPAIIPDGAINMIVETTDKATTDWIVDKSSVEGLFGDYDAPNQLVRHVTRAHGLPLTFWRSVGHSYTAFAKESAMDELAHAAGIDPVAFRLRNAKNNPRLQNVIKVAAEHMRNTTLPEGHAMGIAAHTSFFSHVAEVAQVSVESGNIRVHRVLCVVDCGQAVNPDIVKAQMEGSVMYGLTAALHGNLEVENGAIRESNFHDYPILRMHEAPAVDVVVMDSDEAPTGVGEPGLPPVAPAVANAVFAATGKRLRSLPFRLA